MKKIPLEFISKTELDTYHYAQLLSNQCPNEYSIALHGPLGAGKTTFVRALGQAWNINTIQSPSFNIMDIHQGDRTLIHIDAYRLKSKATNSFDLDDLCTPPFCLIVEWPECFDITISFNAHIFIEILPKNFRKFNIIFK